jgi:hypothetical protein
MRDQWMAWIISQSVKSASFPSGSRLLVTILLAKLKLSASAILVPSERGFFENYSHRAISKTSDLFSVLCDGMTQTLNIASLAKCGWQIAMKGRAF